MNWELRIPPLLLCGLCLLAIAASHQIFPGASLAPGGLPWLASGLMLLGLAIMLAGALQFRLHKTTLDPRYPERTQQIVTSGIYRITRNPMYLGMAIMLSGLSSWWLHLPGYALALAFCVYINRFQIQPEERFLLKQFGENYRAYQQRVRRWI